MPFIRKEVARFVHPKHANPESPDYEWYDLNLPIEAADFEAKLPEGASGTTYNIVMIGRVLVDWSHAHGPNPVPPTTENVRHLDPETLGLIATHMMQASGVRTEAEKKESNSDSSPTTDPAEEATPPSSGI